jgi:hypothetical protein
MPQWGATTAEESKPKNLTEEEKSRTFATTKGWEITRTDGTTEVLVAIRNLSGGDAASSKLGTATISAVYFLNSTFIADTTGTLGRVRVVWNEKITPRTTGTLLIKQTVPGGAYSSVNITATRVGNTTSNFVDYAFEIPWQTSVLVTVPAQTITQGVNDFGTTTVTSQLVIVTSAVVRVAAAASGSTGLTTAVHAPANISRAFFVSTSYAAGATGKVRVQYDDLIVPTTTGTLLVGYIGGSASTITATRAGNTTSNFIEYTFTAPASSNVLYIPAQTITQGVRDWDSNQTTSDTNLVSSEVIGASAIVGGTTSVLVTA